MMLCIPEELNQRLAQAEGVWLFLDYDGTLTDFAPTPNHVNPDPELIDLITGLAKDPRFRIAVISGRRLNHVRSLLPVPGVLLAGTYGVELQTPEGKRIDRVEYVTIRPTLDDIKPVWERLIMNRSGFFLEDKGWALALHARFAAKEEADVVLADAYRLATAVAPEGTFRLLGGHKFLEIGPMLAHKGRTVEYLLESCDRADCLPVYVGDDDKDEEAFGVIKAHGGIAVLVAGKPRTTQADCRLKSPQAVRKWLRTLCREGNC